MDLDPPDFRTPEERARDAKEIESALRCETSLLLSAFEILGFDNFVSPDEMAHELGVSDVSFVQARLDDLVKLDQVIKQAGRYKANLQKWRSSLATS
jgi:hypothetical protein